MQTVLSAIIVPIAMILGGLIGGTAGGDSIDSLFGEQLAYFKTDAWWRSDLWVVMIVFIAVGIFFGSFNNKFHLFSCHKIIYGHIEIFGNL